jgi:diadenosine tetraphosphate (Ap4A) HIT family hydrolase
MIPIVCPKERAAVEHGCPFYDRIASSQPVAANDHAIAFPDGFPVSDGHTLVVPRRHVSSLWDLAPSELRDIWDLVNTVRQLLTSKHSPDGFNIGVNDGAAAGQTVDHAHLHIIPRYSGDVPDPRGGIRLVLPERARYWPE